MGTGIIAEQRFPLCSARGLRRAGRENLKNGVWPLFSRRTCA